MHIFFEDRNEHTNVVKGFSKPPQKGYDPYLNSYNSRWQDHPKFMLWAEVTEFPI